MRIRDSHLVQLACLLAGAFGSIRVYRSAWSVFDGSEGLTKVVASFGMVVLGLMALVFLATALALAVLKALELHEEHQARESRRLERACLDRMSDLS
jgi:hypothetical protein